MFSSLLNTSDFGKLGVSSLKSTYFCLRNFINSSIVIEAEELKLIINSWSLFIITSFPKRSSLEILIISISL
jgi:hypothetical protein